MMRLDISNLHNNKKSVNLVTDDKDQYMKNKKYKYVGVIWKYIETFEPETIKLKPLENNYWKNYNNKYGGGGRYSSGKY